MTSPDPGRPPGRPRRLWLLGWTAVAAAAWLLEAVVGTWQYQLAAVRSGAVPRFLQVFPFEAVASLLWVPITVACLWLADRWPLGQRRRHIVPHLVSLAAVVVGRALLVVSLYQLYGWIPPGVPIGRDLVLSSMLTNLVSYLLLTGLAHVVVYARLARERERQAAKARMDALTAQLRPHFLFNALNTIAASVYRQPEQAEAMIVDLAGLLRHALDHDGSALVPLREEVGIGESYLQIERRRFADRLVVSTDIDPAVLDVGIPPFVLQPLLENAVRHGLAPAAGTCRLRIFARRTGDRVEVGVEDDGVGAEPGRSPGVGTANVRERLRQHFGDQGTLTLRPRDGGGTVAVVRVPYAPLSLPAGGSRP